MSTPHGHLKISRKAYQALEKGGDPFWNEKRVFSRWEAWEYILQSAAYRDHSWLTAGHVILVPRGHTPPLALSYLAEAWGWGKKRVRIFLELLIEMDRIRAVSAARTGTVYLVMNYEFYQSGGTLRDTEEGTEGARRGHAEGTQGARNKASKQVSKEGEGAADAGSPDRKVLTIAKRGSQLSADWVPSDKHRELAAELGVDVDAEAEKFRDWAAAAGKPSKDWEASFRNWLRRAVEYGGRRVVAGQVTLDAGVWGA